MAIKNIIAAGIGFSPGHVKYIVTRGFDIGAQVSIPIWQGQQAAGGTWQGQQAAGGTWQGQQAAGGTWISQQGASEYQ